MNELAKLKNLGEKSAQMLIEAGITSDADLRRLGAVAAYLAVKKHRAQASLNLLYALVGALEDIDWKKIKRERKLSLLMQVEDHERTYSKT